MTPEDFGDMQSDTGLSKKIKHFIQLCEVKSDKWCFGFIKIYSNLTQIVITLNNHWDWRSLGVLSDCCSRRIRFNLQRWFVSEKAKSGFWTKAYFTVGLHCVKLQCNLCAIKFLCGFKEWATAMTVFFLHLKCCTSNHTSAYLKNNEWNGMKN